MHRMRIFYVVIAISIWGCGGQETAEQPAQETSVEALDPTGQQVTFWYQHTRERETALQELIAEYNENNEHGIVVKGEYAGAYSDIYNKMVVGIQGDALPSLVVAYQNQAMAYYRDGGIVDVAPYMNSPKWGLSADEKSDFIQSFLEQDFIGGAQVGFPPNRSLEVFYYNVDWLRELGFDSPPRTWDEFAQMCRLARDNPFSRSEDKDRSLGFLIEAEASRLASLVFTRGGDLVDPTSSRYTIETPAMRGALSMLRGLMEDGSIELMGEEYGDQREFAAGQVLFILRSSSGLPFVTSAVEDGLDFTWTVTYPPNEVEEPIINVYGASVSLCKTTPQQQLAAWLFIKWFTEPAQQARWVRASNYFPVRRSTASELGDYFEENARYKAAFELLDFGKSEPTLSGYQQVRRVLQEAMVEIIEGGDMDRVLADVQQAANRTIQ
ncbi:MAG: extracellular solute-binding protein [Candidatus Latescibacterota bacterium]|nr:extracellular solute-binding protein [Candidatus Latescibacterota bacterium]